MFSISSHYAGDVVYDSTGFLDKNKDTLFQDFKRLLYSSKDSNIRTMWPEGAQDIHKVIYERKNQICLFRSARAATDDAEILTLGLTSVVFHMSAAENRHTPLLKFLFLLFTYIDNEETLDSWDFIQKLDDCSSKKSDI